jgi:hypothetical protein
MTRREGRGEERAMCFAIIIKQIVPKWDRSRFGIQKDYRWLYIAEYVLLEERTS